STRTPWPACWCACATPRTSPWSWSPTTCRRCRKSRIAPWWWTTGASRPTRRPSSSSAATTRACGRSSSASSSRRPRTPAPAGAPDMATRRQHIKLGIFILAVALLLAVTLAFVGGQRLWEDDDTYFVISDETISGIDVDSPVTLRGVKVGQVSAVQLDRSDFG